MTERGGEVEDEDGNFTMFAYKCQKEAQHGTGSHKWDNTLF